MASKYLLPIAPSVAQVDSLTLGGTWEANDVLNITITSPDGVTTQTLSVVAGSTTIATIVATVVTAFNSAATGGSASYTLFSGITASNASPVVTLTGTAGVPFACTVATTENGGGAADSQTFIRTAATAASSPYDWSLGSNWSDGVAPVTGDTVYIDSRAGSNSILYGLNQTAVTLAALFVDLGFTGNCGSLTSRLRISATLFRYGSKPTDGSSPSGSSLFNIDLGSNAAIVLVDGTRNSGTSGQPPLMIKGTHASNTLTVQGNSFVGVGTFVPGETSTLATIGDSGSGQVTLGTNVTLADLTHTGSGKLIINSAISGTLKSTAGTVSTYGTGLIATIDAQGGTMFLNHRTASGDSVSTLQLNGAVVDVRQDIRPLTINATTYAGGKYLQASSTQTTFTSVSFVFTEDQAGTYSVPA